MLFLPPIVYPPFSFEADNVQSPFFGGHLLWCTVFFVPFSLPTGSCCAKVVVISCDEFVWGVCEATDFDIDVRYICVGVIFNDRLKNEVKDLIPDLEGKEEEWK